MTALFTLEKVTKNYAQNSSSKASLGPLDLQIERGARLAIVGESGSGKTTLLRLLLAEISPTSGQLTYLGQPLTPANKALRKNLRSASGIILQDPGTSFNPFLKIAASVLEPAKVRGQSLEKALHRARLLTAAAGLPLDALERYPHELSGGQKQRLAAVRALVSRPEILFADEPVSALDSVSKEKFVASLAKLTKKPASALTTIVVTHNLEIVPQIADTVVVLEKGQLRETGSVSEVFARPKAAYTKKLLAASGLWASSPSP